jgi:microsomal dipeptidase-like Zn-dependent dipeptidase
VNWLPIDLNRNYRDDEAKLISQGGGEVGLASAAQ